MLDTEEKVDNGSRHAVYMRWAPDAGFIVLSQTVGREPSGKPLRLHQVGLITSASGSTISKRAWKSSDAWA